MSEAWVKLAERANRLAERLAHSITEPPIVAKCPGTAQALLLLQVWLSNSERLLLYQESSPSTPPVIGIETGRHAQPPCCLRRLSYADPLPEIVALKSTANS